MKLLKKCFQPGHAGSRRRQSALLVAGLGLTLAACGEKPSLPQAPVGENVMITLPAPRQRGEKSLEETILSRRSVRAYGDRALRIDEISQLLWAAQGITDERRRFRAAPSAGATFPLETYAVTTDGVYRYHQNGHRLEQLAAADRRPALAAAALGQDCVRTAPLTVVFTAVPERTTRRYGERGRMYIHMEAGHAAQNLHLQAVALGLASVPVGAFDPDRVAKLLDIPAAETVLYLVPVGAPRTDAR